MNKFQKWIKEGFMDKGASDIAQGTTKTASTAKEIAKKTKEKIKAKFKRKKPK